MKRIFFVALSILALFMGTGFAGEVVGKITALNGQAWVVKENKAKTSASLGMNLENGDQVITSRKTFLQIKFIDGSKVNMLGDSTLIVKLVLFDEKTSLARIDLQSKKGTYQFFSGKIGEIAPKNFRLRTDTATVGIQGSNGMMKDFGSKGSSFSGHGVTLYPRYAANFVDLLSKAKSDDPKERESLKNLIKAFNTPKELSSIIDSNGELQVIFTADDSNQESFFFNLDASHVSSIQKVKGSLDQVFKSYSKVITGKKIDDALLFPANYQTKDSLKEFNASVQVSSEDLRMLAATIQNSLENGEKGSSLDKQLQAFAYVLNQTSSKIETLKVDLNLKIIDQLPQSDVTIKTKKALENKKERISKLSKKRAEILEEYSKSNDPKVLEKLKDLDKQSDEDTSTKEEEKTERKTKTPKENHVISIYNISKDQDTQTINVTDTTTIKTNREILESALSSGLADFKGRATLDDSGTITQGDVYYFSDTDIGKSALSQNGSSSQKSLYRAGQGIDFETQEAGSGYAFVWFVSDLDEELLGMDINELEIRGSGSDTELVSNGGVTDGALFHISSSSGDQNLVAVGGKPPVNLPDDASGRERFLSKPDDTTGLFSGNTISGFTPSVNEDETFSIAEIDYDNKQIMLSVMDDNRKSYEVKDGQVLGYLFNVGQSTPSNQVTRVNLPSNYGNNLITYVANISNGTISASGLKIYHPQGFVETDSSSGTWDFISSYVSGYSSTASTSFYNANSTTKMPQSAAFDLELTLISPISSEQAASVKSSVFSPGTADTSSVAISSLKGDNVYTFGMVSPVVKMLSITPSLTWGVTGAAYGMGAMTPKAENGTVNQMQLDALNIFTSNAFKYDTLNTSPINILVVSGDDSSFVIDAESFVVDLAAAPFSDVLEVNRAIQGSSTSTANPYVTAMQQLQTPNILASFDADPFQVTNSVQEGASFLRSSYSFQVYDPSLKTLRDPIDTLVMGDINILGEGYDFSIPGLQSTFVGGVLSSSPETVTSFSGMGRFQSTRYTIADSANTLASGTIGASLKESSEIIYPKFNAVALDTGMGVSYFSGYGVMGDQIIKNFASVDGGVSLDIHTSIKNKLLNSTVPFGVSTPESPYDNIVQAFFIGQNANNTSQPDGMALISSPGVDFMKDLASSTSSDGNAFMQLSGAVASVTPFTMFNQTPNALSFGGNASGVILYEGGPPGGPVGYYPELLNRDPNTSLETSQHLKIAKGNANILPMPINPTLKLAQGGSYVIPYGEGKTVDSKVTINMQNAMPSFVPIITGEESPYKSNISFGSQSNLIANFDYYVTFNTTSSVEGVDNKLILLDEVPPSVESSSTSGDVTSLTYSTDFLTGTNGLFKQQEKAYANDLALGPVDSNNNTLFTMEGSISDIVSNFDDLTLSKVLDVPSSQGSSTTLINVPLYSDSTTTTAILNAMDSNDYSFVLLGKTVESSTTGFDLDVKGTTRDDLNAKSLLIGSLVDHGYDPQSTSLTDSPDLTVVLSPTENSDWTSSGFLNAPIEITGTYKDFFKFIDNVKLENLNMTYLGEGNTATFTEDQKASVLTNVIPTASANVAFLSDSNVEAGSFTEGGSSLLPLFKQFNDFLDAAEVVIGFGYQGPTNQYPPEVKVMKFSNESPISKTNNPFTGEIKEYLTSQDNYGGYQDYTPLTLQGNNGGNTVNLFPYSTFQEIENAAIGIHEIISSNTSFSVYVNGEIPADLSGVTLDTAISKLASYSDASSFGLFLEKASSTASDKENLFAGTFGNKTFILQLLNNFKLFVGKSEQSLFSLIGSSESYNLPFAQIVEKADTLKATEGGDTFTLINDHHQVDNPFKIAPTTLNQIADTLDQLAKTDYKIYLQSTPDTPSMTGPFSGLLTAIKGINLSSPVNIDMKDITLTQTGSSDVFIQNIQGDSAPIIDFKETVEPVYVSKDLFMVDSTTNFAGISYLPSGTFDGNLSLIAIPGLEKIPQLSWGFWTTSDVPTGKENGGVGFFVAGPRENLTTLNDISSIPTNGGTTTYTGLAFAGMFAASTNNGANTSDGFDMLFGTGSLSINPSSAEILSGSANLFSGDITDPTSHVKLAFEPGTIVVDSEGLGLAVGQAGVTLTKIDDDTGYIYKSQNFPLPDAGSIQGSLKGNFYNNDSDIGKVFGGSFQVQVPQTENSHFIFGGVGLQR